MARTLKLTAALALSTLALAACNESERRAGAVAGLCIPFAGATTTDANAAPVAPAGPSAAMDDCLHRWGYALAGSSDPADQVAGAVVAACMPALTRWNQQSLAPTAGPTGGAPPSEAQSLITGEDTNAMAERYRYAQDRALFYVVQGRAGKCAAPPMRNGVPDGATRTG
ncbi:hypothetical protein [Phenylobacterium sp. J367]|uniref:hypothetical protein n=1 Tax=Phenylobacterium sp. J367 TaxID=2898435 RepID=UPI002150A09D|nr:hypothetical protein [Phenylobacterium sp. J367]MCR5877650.1 hypothetical protein [Phenylobacterium sp. J367]